MVQHLFNIETGNTYKSSVSYSEIFGNKILDLAREDKEIYTLSAAMIKGTGLDKFSKEFPDRVYRYQEQLKVCS